MAEGEALALDSRWRKVCSETLSLVCRNKDAWIFKDPVIESRELSHDAKVAYSAIIPNPMDFSTIRKNLVAFDSPAEFEADMLQVFRNCYSFNRPGQDAYEMGRDVENVFLAKWELERRKEIATGLYQRAIQIAHSVGSDILISSRRKAKRSPPVYDAINQKVVYEPVSSGGSSSSSETASSSWEDLMKELFFSIKSNPAMVWFLKPVHRYPEIPKEVQKTYYSIIRTPMDMETVEKNIDLYPSPAEFRRDMELIVTNSVRFNPPGSPVNAAALALQAAITEAFQNPTLLTAANTLSRDWIKRKRVIPESPPEEVADVTTAPPTVLRLKRGSGPMAPQSPTESSLPTPSPTQKVETKQPPRGPAVPSILSLSRPMRPPPLQVESWKQLASHVLEELSNLKDENGTRLAWIFQRPIHKYELPANIKRLYLLSIPDVVDLGIIEARLKSSEYDPVSFERDMEVLLDNCLVFNDETQYPHKVAFVLKKHFNDYWANSGLRERAREMSSSGTCSMSTIFGDGPNWNEIRQQAAPGADQIMKDCDGVSALFPLNDELLYEWRVSQRYVMHQLRKKNRN